VKPPVFFRRGRLELPFIETGMRAQLRHHPGLRARAGQHRANTDLVALGGKGVLLAGVVYGVWRLTRPRRQPRRRDDAVEVRHVRRPRSATWPGPA
jgi:hypothetical protein